MNMIKEFEKVEWIGPERDVPLHGVKKSGDEFEVSTSVAVDLEAQGLIRRAPEKMKSMKPRNKA